MEYREFGRAGAKVSVIGMGTYYDLWFIGLARLLGHHRKRGLKIAALRKGLDLGINLIDTAEIYETEGLVGEAMRGFRRDELFIATKVWLTHLRFDKVLRAAHRSLERLGCGYIDLYQIHFPNPTVPVRETMQAMERLVVDGRVRFIGVSNFSLRRLVEAQECLSKYEIISNQVEYSLGVRRAERRLLPYCEANRIAVLAYRPVAHGRLARPRGRLGTVMLDLSHKYGGKTPSQIANNWLINKSPVVFSIPRASRPERVVENAGSVGWALAHEDMRRLEEAA